MVFLKRFSLILLGLLLTVFIAACSNPMSGNTTTGSTTTGSKTTTTTNGNTTYGNSSGMATPTTGTMGNTNTMGNGMATPTTGTMGNGNTMGNANALIHTTQVTLNGQMITVLTNAKGMVLYYKLDDPRPASSCTGACATDWPPVIANAANMMTVSSTMQLPHQLTVVMTANGSQVEYDGHPLYTYAGDMTPGQFAGRGIGNVWYLVSLAL